MRQTPEDAGVTPIEDLMVGIRIRWPCARDVVGGGVRARDLRLTAACCMQGRSTTAPLDRLPSSAADRPDRIGQARAVSRTETMHDLMHAGIIRSGAAASAQRQNG